MNNQIFKSTILGLALLAAFTAGATSKKETATSSQVYICTGPKAYVYHSISDCSGLNRCSASVVSVSLSKARAMGRRACRKCY